MGYQYRVLKWTADSFDLRLALGKTTWLRLQHSSLNTDTLKILQIGLAVIAEHGLEVLVELGAAGRHFSAQVHPSYLDRDADGVPYLLS